MGLIPGPGATIGKELAAQQTLAKREELTNDIGVVIVSGIASFLRQQTPSEQAINNSGQQFQFAGSSTSPGTEGLPESSIISEYTGPGSSPGTGGLPEPDIASPIDTSTITTDGPILPTGDPVSDERVAELHPEIQHRSAAFVNQVKEELGIQLRVTDGLRTFDEQNALYAQGRTGPGNVVTNAQGGRSYHNYGLAIDVVELRPDGSVDYGTDYNAIAEIGKQHGFDWGGDFTSITDKPHFEFTGGYSTRELLELSNGGANPYVPLD